MASLFTWENWPVLVVCAGMIAAAVIDWWKFKVPNRLTFPLIISGWLLGLANNFGLGAGAETGPGGLGACAFAKPPSGPICPASGWAVTDRKIVVIVTAVKVEVTRTIRTK